MPAGRQAFLLSVQRHLDRANSNRFSSAGAIVKVIVLGATGRVGPYAVAALAHAGHIVTALARRPSQLEAAAFITADLADSAAITAAARGQDAAFLITPNGENELALAESAIAALEAAGVGRIAYLGVNNAKDRRSVPHFAYKVAIERRLAASPIPCVILGPGYFFQNDAAALPVILNAGVYPSPIGEIGISAVDARDVADALVNVLFDDAWVGQTVPILSADVLTGPGAAAIWSDVMGKSVRYGGDDTAGLEGALTRAGASSWLIDDLCQMMRQSQAQGALPRESQQDIARRAVGHEPRRYRDFVAEVLTRE